MDGAWVLFDRGQRFAPVAGLERLVPGPGEHAAGKTAHGLFVIDYQDGEAAWGPLQALGWLGPALRIRIRFL
jgi:hypothetical protein